ncbi:hypothetical protein ACFLTE_04830 [Bacteroidota bacterium]
MENNVKKRIKTFSTILSIVIVVSVSFNFIQFYKKQNFSKRDSVFIQNELLRSEIRKSRIEINKYKGISSEIDQIVKEANEKIAKQEITIKKLVAQKKDFEEDNMQLTEEIVELKESYLEIIDSLLIEQDLNQVLAYTIEEMEEEIVELKNKVGLGSTFMADNIDVRTLIEKEHGNSKKTALAKKTKVINVCFDILENKLKDKGYYDIFLRVVDPKSETVLSDDDNKNTFINPFTKEEMIFSATKAVTYNNERISTCVRFHPKNDLIAGVYLVEIYTIKGKIGATTFTLK